MLSTIKAIGSALSAIISIGKALYAAFSDWRSARKEKKRAETSRKIKDLVKLSEEGDLDAIRELQRIGNKK